MADTASWQLRQAIYQALVSDAGLAGLLGGGRIYEHVPHGVGYPYVTFGPSVVRDWSTATEGGEEHLLTFHVWSGEPGIKEVEAIVAALRAALDGASLSMTNHRLVNLRYEQSEVRRGGEAAPYQAIVRYRAVTEPMP